MISMNHRLCSKWGKICTEIHVVFLEVDNKELSMGEFITQYSKMSD